MCFDKLAKYCFRLGTHDFLNHFAINIQAQRRQAADPVGFSQIALLISIDLGDLKLPLVINIQFLQYRNQ